MRSEQEDTLERLEAILAARGATLSLRRQRGLYVAQVEGIERPFEVVNASLESAVLLALLVLRGREIRRAG